MSLARVLASVFLVIFVLSCNSSQKKTGTPVTGAGAFGPKQMQNMAGDVKALLPYLYDRDAFHNPANKENIHDALKQFASVAHKIKPETGKNF